MGELATLYAAGDVAFVGGSLVPLGGQNMLEPAVLGLPIVCGPHTFNFAQVADELEKCGGLIRVGSAAELATAVVHLLQSEADRREQGRRAKDYVIANRGAADKVAAKIAELIPR
jgi:3-deoxy-D-manno-octulosonic-acid transferase